MVNQKIVERIHRTIKTIAERSSISPLEAVFWYNVTPKSGQIEASVPQRSLFTYEWRYPFVEPKRNTETESPLVVGEEVWVKPPNARCTTSWKTGRVTQINSSNNVSADGVPRHVLDIRRMVMDSSSSSDPNSDDDVEGGRQSPELARSTRRDERRYPARVRRRPVWTEDYDCEDCES